MHENQIKLNFARLNTAQMCANSEDFLQRIQQRRSVRHFSDEKIEQQVVCNAVQAAATAPSGANKQPWHFVVISNPEVKKAIRKAAEIEESEFYHGRAPDAWLDDLKPLNTDEHKPFLEEAPYLIAVFLERHSIDAHGNKHKNYYMPESVGIATGFLLASLHFAGCATLTHTPSPMKFLNTILERPKNEKPFMLIVVGYPKADASVPDISRKDFTEIATIID